LDATGIGENCRRAGDQAKELQIADRLDRPRRLDPAGVERRPRARMDREDHRHVVRDLAQCVHRLGEQRPVDQCGAVQRHHQVAAALAAVEPIANGHERIDHRVADVVDGRLRPPLAEQVVAGFG